MATFRCHVDKRGARLDVKRQRESDGRVHEFLRTTLADESSEPLDEQFACVARLVFDVVLILVVARARRVQQLPQTVDVERRAVPIESSGCHSKRTLVDHRRDEIARDRSSTHKLPNFVLTDALAATEKRMIAILALFVLSALATTKQEVLLDDLLAASSSSDSAVYESIVSAVGYLLDRIRCGHAPCSSTTDAASDGDLAPLFEITDDEFNDPAAIGEAEALCVTESIRVTLQAVRIFGQPGVVYRGDVFGRSLINDRLYLVHTDDLEFASDEADAFRLLRKRFPLGSTTECLPAFLRANKKRSEI